MKQSARRWRGSAWALAWSFGTACAAAIAWQGVYQVYGADRREGTVIITPRGAGIDVVANTPAPESGSAGDRTARRPRAVDPARSPARRHARAAAVPGPRAGPSIGPSTGVAGSPGARTVDYHLVGGVVLLAQNRVEARLASARPEPGWRRESWNGPDWLRVDFTRGERVNTLIATWNGHPPEVQFSDHT